mmetsp:Transcript_99455/g.197078  ORF Transcript_99455/g.197078 Transcript_99455/m.197078 type:complete len:183 (+) Transcript_99455:38-586(+)
MLGAMFGGDEDEESNASSEDNEGAFSGVRFFTEVCGVAPSCCWAVTLAIMTGYFWNSECTVSGRIPLFLLLSLFFFALIVTMGTVEGCYAGEPDFRCSPLELATFCGTITSGIILIVLNYWGCVQIVNGESCSEHLKLAGWITLVGNNIFLFSTAVTSVVLAFPQILYAGADKALGDRLGPS